MNNLIDKKNTYNQLFFYYKGLLTNRQREIFEAYYESDFTLQEIADDLDISKNAVFDALKNVTKSLENFESILKLNELANKRSKLYANYLNVHTEELINKLKEME